MNMPFSTIAIGGVIALGVIYISRKSLKNLFDSILYACSNPNTSTSTIQMVPPRSTRKVLETKTKDAASAALPPVRMVAIPPGGKISMTIEEFNKLPNKEKYLASSASGPNVRIYALALEANENPPVGWSKRKELTYGASS